MVPTPPDIDSVLSSLVWDHWYAMEYQGNEYGLICDMGYNDSAKALEKGSNIYHAIQKMAPKVRHLLDQETIYTILEWEL